MPSDYVVRTVRFASGERFPILVERNSGLPLHDPTVFALTEVRAGNRASRTIDQVARAISIFHAFVDTHSIGIDARLLAGKVLDLSEIDALARYCRLPLSVLSESTQKPFAVNGRANPAHFASLEKVRMSSRVPPSEIQPNSAGIRLRYIRDYLQWLIRNQLHKLDYGRAEYKALESSGAFVIASLNARLPAGQGRNVMRQRQGLSDDALKRLLEIIEPDSPDNPWTSSHARERNCLALQWLTQLGVRRGELLGVRIREIDFQSNEVFIARRADDPDDPRKDQPDTKTRDRILPLSDDLAQRTRRYIMGFRRDIKGARLHDLLFVANGTGAPLTLSALNKIFISFREKFPELPQDLTPHVLRHTWNDQFSKMIDQLKAGGEAVSEEREQQIRSYLAGWADNSGTAAVYTRRHIQEKSKTVSLELQKSLLKTKNDK